MTIQQLPLDKIKPQALQRPFNESALDQLASSVRSLGILEPLLVAQRGDEFFLIAGQRRLAAAKRVGLGTVPCIIVPADQEQALAISLHENIYRENLNPMDEADLYQYLQSQLGYSNRRIAEMITKSESYVSQRLGALHWDPQLVEGIRDSSLSFSVARELARVDDVSHRRYLIKHARADGVNYRTVRTWVCRYIGDKATVEKEESLPSMDKGRALSGALKTDCYWCETSVDIDTINNVFLCDPCFEDLAKVKEKSRRKDQDSGLRPDV